MKIHRYKSWLPIAFTLFIVVSLFSCKQEEKSSQVELLSFGPSGVKLGEEIAFIGNNLDQVTAIELANATVEKSAFLEQTSEVIRIMVPLETEKGLVTLKTPQGDILSKTALSLAVPLDVTSFPMEAKPGTDITIAGENMNWIEEVWFADDVLVTEFVSSSATELVVTVPMEAKTGALSFYGGGTDPVTLETETQLVITLPSITDMSPNPVERGADLTITGQNLDLTTEVMFKGGAMVLDFVSISETEIVVTVPEDANQGKIILHTASGVGVESTEILNLVGALPPLDDLGSAFYTDDLENGWQKWDGWGSGSVDMANDENVRQGEKAIKVTFGGDWGGAMQLGGGNPSTTGFTKIVFAMFGSAGTGGKEFNAIVKVGGTDNSKTIAVVEGEWTLVEIPLSEVGSPSVINEFTLQDRGFSGSIYVDHIGLK